MLTFFRRIRKGLLGSAQARRYMVYAIGEILLVMIGILLALQVNNWNTDRILKAQEKSILEEVKRNIETNIIEANQDYSVLKEKHASLDIIMNHLKSDEPFHDSLSDYFEKIYGSRYFNSVTSGYQVLKNNSEIRLADEMRFELSAYFEERVFDVEYAMNSYKNYYFNYIENYFRLHFETSFTQDQGATGKLIPRDYSELKRNDSFRASLNLLKREKEYVMTFLIRFQEQSNEVLAKLQTYLNEEFNN
jgi:hypothetical protein